MRKLWAWCRSHPILFLTSLLVVAAVTAHFAADALSERRWQRYCEAARARGVPILFEELVPAEVPDEENFLMIPLLLPNGAGTVPRAFNLSLSGQVNKLLGNPNEGVPPDWTAVRSHLQKLGWIKETTDQPARDALRALDCLNPSLAEWTEGLSRPHTHFPIDFKNPMMLPMPQLGTFIDVPRVLALRMGARLELGDSAGAYAEWQLGLRSAERLQRAQLLITGMVQQFMHLQLLHAAAYGLEKHQWAEPELARLSEDLASLNLLKSRESALAGERAAFNSMFEQMITSTQARRNLAAAGLYSPPQKLAIVLMPRRVLRDNQLRQNQWIDEMLAKANPETGEYHPNAPTPSDPESAKGLLDPIYFHILRLSSGSYNSVSDAYVANQVKVRQARIACALERFWLRHGQYPERLDELSPEWLKTIPADLYRPAPMMYQRVDKTSYRLWSVGPDQKDDEGKMEASGSGKTPADAIWLFAPRPAAVEQ